MAVFFLALAVAAFTSLTAMVEVVTRALTDSGMTRRTAVQTTAAGGFLLGLPSALSLKVLENQDWVWSMALTLSGLFFAAAVIAKGVRSFRNAYLNHEHSDIAIGSWWDFTISTLVPAEAIGLFLWLLTKLGGTIPKGGSIRSIRKTFSTSARCFSNWESCWRPCLFQPAHRRLGLAELTARADSQCGRSQSSAADARGGRGYAHGIHGPCRGTGPGSRPARC